MIEINVARLALKSKVISIQRLVVRFAVPRKVCLALIIQYYQYFLIKISNYKNKINVGENAVKTAFAILKVSTLCFHTVASIVPDLITGTHFAGIMASNVHAIKLLTGGFVQNALKLMIPVEYPINYGGD